ncbi:MAG: TIGR03862 family flavoprotein, partial [Gammaproteobacteria bacterium]|nr:TIGR03862 family flavoprotein [Gammaproteobacteria bacterium]
MDNQRDNQTGSRLNDNAPNIAIIGAGPAGLMAAEVLADAGYPAVVYEAMPSAARKFLQAGRGGLNLTHDDVPDAFESHYFEASAHLKPALAGFSPTDMRDWAAKLGFETFVGSSGKVYPMDKKAAPLLRKWLQQLKQKGTLFKMKHRWQGWQETVRPKSVSQDSATPLIWAFETPEGMHTESFDYVILALGGASWPHLGSTGRWLKTLQQKQVEVVPFEPSNMGFEVVWSAVFKDKFAGTPLKNVQISLIDVNGSKQTQLGELMVTEQGVEGSLIYTFSSHIREQLKQNSPFTLHLDLFPHRSLMQLTEQLSAHQQKQGASGQAGNREKQGKKTKQSVASFWKRIGLQGVKASLLREVLTKSELIQPGLVAQTLKKYPLTLVAPSPIEQAISSAGGVAFSSVDEQLMLKALPQVFCAGEMLDWEAP